MLISCLRFYYLFIYYYMIFIQHVVSWLLNFHLIYSTMQTIPYAFLMLLGNKQPDLLI